MPITVPVSERIAVRVGMLLQRTGVRVNAPKDDVDRIEPGERMVVVDSHADGSLDGFFTRQCANDEIELVCPHVSPEFLTSELFTVLH